MASVQFRFLTYSVALLAIVWAPNACSHPNPFSAHLTRADYIWTVPIPGPADVTRWAAGIDGAGTALLAIYRDQPLGRFNLKLRGRCLTTDSLPKTRSIRRFERGGNPLASLDEDGNLWVRDLLEYQELGVIDEPIITHLDHRIRTAEDRGIPPKPIRKSLIGLPMKFAFVPDDPDSLFLTNLFGQIYHVHIPSRTARLFHSWVPFGPERTIYASPPQGLQGITFHPEFNGTGEGGKNFLYVYYTHPEVRDGDSDTGLAEAALLVEAREKSSVKYGSVYNRIHRFEVLRENGQYRWVSHHDLPSDESPLELFSSSVGHDENADPWIRETGNHQGGHLAFGNPKNGDPLLYLTTGDTSFDPYETKTRAQHPGHSAGKFLRMDMDGYPVPGNPLNLKANDRTTIQNYIVALGLDNPFSFTVREGTDRVYIADTGSEDGDSALEEVVLLQSTGIDIAYKDVFNLGWPRFEGYASSGTGKPWSRTPRAWQLLDERLKKSPEKVGDLSYIVSESNHTDPIIAYRHDAFKPESRFPSDRGALTGIDFFDENLPSAFPTDFAGDLVLLDFNKESFFRIDPNNLPKGQGPRGYLVPVVERPKSVVSRG